MGITQVTRIYLHQRSLGNGTASDVAQKDAKDVAETAKGVVTDPKGAANTAGLK